MVGGNITANAWDSLLTTWPYSERMLFAVGFAVILEVVTLVYSMAFVGLERCRLCQQWRVEPYPEVSSPPAKLIQEAFRDHLVNALVLRPLLGYFTFPLFAWCGMHVDAASLPGLSVLLWHLFVSMLIDDAWFYWTHRALHTRWLYRTIHKQHHRFRFTHVLASEFAHPVEDASNTIGTMLGPLILGSHMSVTWLYGAIKLAQVQTRLRC